MFYITKKDKTLENVSFTISASNRTHQLVNQTHKNKRNHQMTKNMTRMVIFSYFISMVGETPYSICFLLSTVGLYSPNFIAAFSASTILLFFSPALDVFTYYFFNKMFKSVLNGYAKHFNFRPIISTNIRRY